MSKNISRLTFGLMLTVVGFASQAYAGLVLSPAFSYLQTSDKSATTDTSSTATLIDLKGGFEFTNGFYLGGEYVTNSYKIKTGTTTQDQAITAYGPSAGIVYNGLSFIATYYMASDYQYDSSTTYTSGTGMQFDLGYRFGVGSSVAFGPYLSVRNFEYKKVTAGGVTSDLSSTYKHGETTPYLAFFISF